MEETRCGCDENEPHLYSNIGQSMSGRGNVRDVRVRVGVGLELGLGSALDLVLGL